MKLHANSGELRGAIYENQHVFSTHDFIYKACGASPKKILRNLRKACGDMYICKVIGSGPTPCMTVQGLKTLMYTLGVNVSPSFRSDNLDILDRYLDGNMSMIEEIVLQNIHSEEMIHRKREEMQFEMHIDERRLNLDAKRVALTESRLRLISEAMDIIDSVNESIHIDKVTTERFEEQIKSAMGMS